MKKILLLMLLVIAGCGSEKKTGLNVEYVEKLLAEIEAKERAEEVVYIDPDNQIYIPDYSYQGNNNEGYRRSQERLSRQMEMMLERQQKVQRELEWQQMQDFQRQSLEDFRWMEEQDRNTFHEFPGGHHWTDENGNGHGYIRTNSGGAIRW